MNKMLHLKAYAKLNLALDVTGRREDGYHMVRMVMQSVRLYDRVSMARNHSGKILLKTNLAYLPTDERNLVYKAIDLLRREYDITEGVSVTIDKHIPVAAGLAGGSSDAAAALIGMNHLFKLGIRQKELMRYGLSLGADIPFCIMRGTALAEGIGEILTPLPPIPPCWFVLVKPAFSMSTRFVYQNLVLDESTLHPPVDDMCKAIHSGDLDKIVDSMGNVLEQVTAAHFPDILRIKEELVRQGARASLMSGSGSTVFGIFDDEELAHHAVKQMKKLPLIKLVRAVMPFQKTPAHTERR